MAGYVPEAGDLVWLTFDPQAGREQAGRRPALVVSPASYNGKSGARIVMPDHKSSKEISLRGCATSGIACFRGRPGGSTQER
jgi:mRNA-degrading endonuclease toxin of MazEF toxin-antitoxin module